jgi:hypothetical protein
MMLSGRIFYFISAATFRQILELLLKETKKEGGKE